MEEVNVYNRNKAIIVTVVVHVTAVLLMLLSFKGCVNLDDMETSDGGVMVSFGEINAGGGTPDDQNVQESQTQPDVQPDPQPDNSDAAPDAVETNPDSDATVNSAKKRDEQKEKEQKPTIDSEMQRRVDAAAKRAAEKKQQEGEGGGDKPGKEGDPNSDRDGPPGTGGGPVGSGPGMNLAGFSHGGIPSPKNESQYFEKIRIAFCVDRNGNIISAKSDPSCRGCGNNKYLVDLTIETLYKVNFRRTSSAVGNRNCGSFIVDYRKN